MKKLYGLMALVMVSAVAKDPNFSIKNKSEHTVTVQVEQDPNQTIVATDTTLGHLKGVVKQYAQEAKKILAPTTVHYKLNDITNEKKLFSKDKIKPVGQGGYKLGQAIELKANRSFALELPDAEKGMEGSPYLVSVWYNDGQGRKRKVSASFVLKKNDTFHIKFQYDEKEVQYMLMPQEGVLFKSTEGYSLSNNVKKVFTNTFDSGFTTPHNVEDLEK